MNQKVFSVRLNLDDEAERRAWEYLRKLDRKKYKSYSRVIATAVNDFFERQERAGLYLETQEKEDAFLQRVLETVECGLRTCSLLIPQNPDDVRQIFSKEAQRELEERSRQAEMDEAALAFIDSL